MSAKYTCATSACLSRRALLGSALGVSVAAMFGGVAFAEAVGSVAFTREQRDQLTPDQVLGLLRSGNERFRTGRMQPHNYLAQKQQTAGGQFPAAAILSCIDSRAPAEILLDTRIGDTFNARIAGNVADDDVLGSLEFACAAAGAKLVLVMGHTACGAVKGAIDGVELGHLTGLLQKIKPAVTATVYSGDRSSKDAGFVDAVAQTHVKQTVEALTRQSSILAKLVSDQKIRVVGSMYHLKGGRVEFFA